MIKGFEPRLYQQTILHTAVQKNTLVVIPTGLGKTNIAVLLAASRLKNYPESKILVLAPTRPLCDQHVTSMRNSLEVGEDEVSLFTGMIRPEKRAQLWKESRIIVSTPQGLENDIISSKISLKDVSLLVFDEAHRAVGDYSYVFVARLYSKRADHPRILGLTASPGSDAEKIKEVCKNLFIEEIEMRSSEDPDVKPYVKDIDVEKVMVELPPEFQDVRNYLKACYDSKLEKIKQMGYLYGDVSSYSKTSLLEMQRALYAKMMSGEKDFDMMKSVSLLAEALKVQHALELVETQGLRPLLEYFEKLDEEAKNSTVKAVQNLTRDLNFRSAYMKTKTMVSNGMEHPKIAKLREIISSEVASKKDIKIIIFNQYRDSSNQIKSVLDGIRVSSKVFFGQAKKKYTGLSQKEQKKVIEEFRENKFNCLIATSVAEEGLDIPQVDLVLFYEPVPSAIRTVQRRGRTGRQEKGRVIMLITKKTRDEGNMWASHHKEKRMYRVIEELKKTFSPGANAAEAKEEQKTLLDDERRQNSLLKIHADYREKASGIIKDLSEQGVNISLSNLEVGDYVLSERVVVEYKKLPDFVDSIIDGRMLSQLANLKKYDRPIILLEGTEDLYSLRKLHPNAIRGVLSTITVSYGIPILQTKNSKETAALFMAIAKREADTSRKDYSLHTAKPLSDKEVQEYIVSAFPGVGPVLSKPILKEFKSIKKFVNASEDDLKKVSLIGEKKAKRIRDVVEKEYE
ncbi:DEAD/DEAH box helicase [Candidatus Woesearchaeota archaeon]|nr:DEAD/DEAH box helicase [Candidatus Woesearchaeota archaeon]